MQKLYPFPIRNFLLFLVLALPSIVWAQDDLASQTESTSLWGLIQQGGWAMYPLGLCSLVMFFLIFYSWKETARSKFLSPEASSQSIPMLAEFRIDEAASLFAQQNTVLSRIMGKSLARIKPEVPEVNKPKAEATLIEQLESEENQIAQWVNYLNVVGAVAPMIGLLGTVSGMISAFQTIGQGGMGKPEMLAENIGEALVTTATGLIVGIPAMIAYFVIRNRLNNAVVATSEIAGDLLDEIPVNIVFDEDN
jgi:biopolymer transport protein ExbB